MSQKLFSQVAYNIVLGLYSAVLSVFEFSESKTNQKKDRLLCIPRHRKLRCVHLDTKWVDNILLKTQLPDQRGAYRRLLNLCPYMRRYVRPSPFGLAVSHSAKKPQTPNIFYRGGGYNRLTIWIFMESIIFVKLLTSNIMLITLGEYPNPYSRGGL